jgi:hypothetical protein
MSSNGLLAHAQSTPEVRLDQRRKRPVRDREAELRVRLNI